MADLIQEQLKYKMALLGIFPNPKAFYDFKQDDQEVAQKALPEFINFAHSNGLIKRPDEKSLVDFIEKNQDCIKDTAVQRGFSFEDLIEEITKEGSVNTLVNELNIIANKFKMAKVQGSMFSRLKRDFNLNTSAKRNCIRILSFWIGENRSYLGWDYKTILKIPRIREKELKIEEQEGVRIAFRLEGRGEIIDTDVVEWLKTELSKCITDLKLYHVDLKNITCFATTVFLNIPKKEGPSGEPRLYDVAVRDSMFIAHQILNRFYLSDYSSQQKALVIAIDAGRFVDLDASLQVLLDVKLQDDPEIRLTSFVRLCSRLADNRVIFYRTPKELKTVNGNILTVWYVECFWTYYYNDFVPRLLEDDMLPTTRKTHVKFNNALYYPYARDTVSFKALSIMHKFPKNDMLILEIAKVCVARRMFRAALVILSTILASNPRHMVAKTYRMSIFLDLAMEQTEFSLFELFHQRAIDEGESIIENCFIEDEEFYCEFGQVYYMGALRIFSILKSGRITAADNEKITLKNVFYNLNEADKLFRKGTVFSSPGIGNRCNFLQMHIYCFKKMLENDQSLYSSEKALIDTNNIYETAGTEFITFLGWTDLPFTGTIDSDVPDDILAARQVNLFLTQILALFHNYENSALFRITFPNTQFTFASMVFDFTPYITVRLVKTVLSLLEQGRTEAEKLIKERIGVYVILSCYGRIHSPERYIRFLDQAISIIEDKVGEDIEEDDDFLIDKSKLDGFKLILLSLEAEVEPGILLTAT